jgi:hypothetical protein
MILFGEESLRTAIHNFVSHYHTERNHQGLANQVISPEPGHLGSAGVVQRRQRLGGMLELLLPRRLNLLNLGRCDAMTTHADTLEIQG